MVKNTIGGKKGKMQANKNGGGGGGGRKDQLRLIEVPGIEIFVCVTKVFGGGLFEVIDNDGNIYRAFLRGRMKGHNKRHNLVSLFSILLVALRIDTDPTKSDILFVYDSHDIQFLALIPSLNISHLLSIHSNQLFNNTNTSTSSNDLLHFSNDTISNSISIPNTSSDSNIHTDTDTDNLDIDIDFHLI
jgi:hypothetical protein